MSDEPDLEAYWQDVLGRPKPLLTVAQSDPAKVESVPYFAAQIAHLLKEDPEKVEKILREFHRLCGIEWKRGGLLGVIETVLGQTDVSVDTLRAFVTALPSAMLQHMVQTAGMTAKGIHALLAIEYVHRPSRGRTDFQDYELQRGMDGVLVVTAYPATTQNAPLTFRLDEIFQVDAMLKTDL